MQNVMCQNTKYARASKKDCAYFQLLGLALIKSILTFCGVSVTLPIYVYIGVSYNFILHEI